MEKTSQISPKEIRRKRTMIYFIEATQQLMQDGDLENITIRKISNTAGYNSATLYNYFKDLNQLISFAAIKNLKEYINDLSCFIKDDMSALEKYLRVWYCFCSHYFKNPKIYNIIFSKSNVTFLSYIKEYYKIFPEELADLSSDVKQMFFEDNWLLRDKILVEKLVKENFIEEKYVDDLISMLNYLCEGIISRLINEKDDLSTEQITKDFIRYIEIIFISFNPDLKQYFGKYTIF